MVGQGGHNGVVHSLVAGLVACDRGVRALRGLAGLGGHNCLVHSLLVDGFWWRCRAPFNAAVAFECSKLSLRATTGF